MMIITAEIRKAVERHVRCRTVIDSGINNCIIDKARRTKWSSKKERATSVCNGSNPQEP